MDQLITSESLCRICRTLHEHTGYVEEVNFGTIAEILAKHECPVCRLVLSMLLPGPEEKYEQQRQSLLSPQKVTLRKMGRDGFIIWQDGIMRGELDYCFPDLPIDASWKWIGQVMDTPYERPDTLDYDKVKRWITRCDSAHDQCSAIHSIRRMRTPVQTYFIDTQDNCLSYKDTSVQYLALSYVWGDAVVIQLKASDCDTLQRIGALLDVQSSFNPVFLDAIEVSRRLGIRYLWIDAICIPQDDELQKANMISQMDSIYAQAYLTIVALSADSADSPLRGVRQSTRLARSALAQVSIPESEERLPNRYLAVRPSLCNVLRHRPYNTRAWTFQESCLSRRCLAFTDNSVFFHCDSVLENDSVIGWTSDAWPERNILLPLFDPQEKSLNSGYQFSIYTQLVFDFSQRKAKYLGDSLNAISGIFAVLASNFGWRFVAGMPSDLVDHALLWRSGSQAQKRNPHFPSWSWAGWIGWSHWDYQSFLDVLEMEPEINKSPLTPLRSDIKILDGLNSEGADSVETSDGVYLPVLHINVEWVPMGKFQIRDRELERERPDQISLAQYQEIWTVDGLRCGILCNFEGQKTGDYKFIALSRSSWIKEKMVRAGVKYGEIFRSWYGHVCDDAKLNFSEYCLVNVMLVVTEKTGTERAGIGFIHEDVWRAMGAVRENFKLR